MKSIEYEQIGEKIKVGEDVLISPGYYDDGLSFGTIFKDERAFYEQPDEVCYIPEAVFAEGHPEIINGKEYYSASDGYTRRNLEELLEGETDDEGEPIDVEYFFQNLVWACPETYLNAMTY